MSYFKSQLEQSGRVVRASCQLFNKYLFSRDRMVPLDIQPSKGLSHPPDAEVVLTSGKVLKYEIKREARSRETGNVFFEKAGLEKVMECGGTHLLMWIDWNESYIDIEIKSLLDWLSKKNWYYHENAGDAKKCSYRKCNPGWAIPVALLIKECHLMDCHISNPANEYDKKILAGFKKYFWTDEDPTYKIISDRIVNK